MIIPVHCNNDSKKSAYLWHSRYWAYLSNNIQFFQRKNND